MGRETTSGGAVCAVVRAETRPGADEQFEALLQDLAFRVRAEEPACLSYVVTRLMGSRALFAVHARFSDWDAFKAHPETDHVSRMLPRLNALLAAPLSLEIFFEV